MCAFKSEKGPLFHELGGNYLRNFFRHKIIFATFVQLKDVKMEGLCSSVKEGSDYAREAFLLLQVLVVSIVCAKDRPEPVK